MSCNFLGSNCTTTSPCCDGFNCNNAGVCDFYDFNTTKDCPKGYSKVYTTDNAGICALDLKTEGSWIIWIVIILFCIVIFSLIGYVIYRVIKHKKLL